MLNESQASRGASNTPAQRTPSEIVRHRHLKILIDWLGFTVNTDFFDLYTVLKLFERCAGIPVVAWQNGRKCYEGYADSVRFENINIYYNGAENQGIHVDITGQGCRYLETQYQMLGVQEHNWFEFIRILQDADVKFTRLDVAIDDFHGYYTVPQLFAKCMAGELTSKFKSWSPDGNFSMDGQPSGITLYFGSPQSRIQVIFYEKNKQLGLQQTWTRTEIRFKQERAQELVKLFLFQDDALTFDIGVIVAGILKDYIMFRAPSPTDSNKRRWPIADFWQEFLGDVERRRLASALPDRSIMKIRSWVNKQVSKSLACMFFAYQDLDQFRDWMNEILTEGRKKLTEQDRQIIEEFRRIYKKDADHVQISAGISV